MALNWRVGPAGFDISDENFLLANVTGGVRALLPLSPVHLKTRIEGGDLHISWIRRGRLNADSWMGEDIPLGEERELYRIEINAADGTTVRSAAAAMQSWTYTASMLAEDFPQGPVAVDITVRQSSTVAGYGIPLRRTVHLT